MKMNMTPRAKKLLAGLTAVALTLSMLPATALAAKGSTLTIQDASGNSVYSAAAPCNVNFAFFSSPKLTLGSSYTLTGGSTTTTATAQTGTTTSNQPGGGQRPDGTGSGTGGQRPSAPADGQQPTPPDGTQQHYAP